MNLFMAKVKRQSEFIAMILFFAAAFLSLLFYIGNFDGDFMPVIGNLIAMFLQVGIWLVIPLCIALKRRSYARYGTLAVALYWLITTLFTRLDDTALATGDYAPIVIAVGVFAFFSACALIVMTVFALIAVIRKISKYKMIACFIYVGTLVFYLVLFCLRVALAAKWGAGWNAYFSYICDYLVVPFAMLFIAISFGFKEEEFVLPCSSKKKADAEIAPEEAAPTEDAPVEDAPAEESPTETPAEEAPTEAPATETPAEVTVEETATEEPAEEKSEN